MINSARYQGRPCKRGHSGIRYKANATCVKCAYALLSGGKYNARKAARNRGVIDQTRYRTELGLGGLK